MLYSIYLFLYIAAMVAIWFSVVLGLVFAIGSAAYLFQQNSITVDLYGQEDNLPTVTIMVPAHNEGKVIATTVENIFKLNYPSSLVQVIIVNDNSQDNTGSELERVKKAYPERDFTILTTDKITGGKGKSTALNNALTLAKNEWICIFDADAAPQNNALKFLILKTFESKKYGAVFGRSKCRNRGRNLLTKFINLELVVSQRINHAGRWFFFKIGQIPGTNFIVRRDLMVKIGGWDTKAITEDTALGFSIMSKGYLIALETRAEAYQQEPEKLSVYIKQRTRWAKGNLYVVQKYFTSIFKKVSWRIKLMVAIDFLTYYFFFTAVIVGDLLLVFRIILSILSIFITIPPGLLDAGLEFNFMLSFILMIALYVIQINVALASDIGQSTLETFVLSILSYFTYSQLWILICLKAGWQFFGDTLFKREVKWYKTERF